MASAHHPARPNGTLNGPAAGTAGPSASTSASASATSTAAAAAAAAAQPTVDLPGPLFDSVEDTVAAFGRGEFVVILDDENRENEGDLIIAADRITAEQMAWLIRWSSGFVCISLHPSIIEYLRLPMMVPENTDRHKTAYTVTLDYKHGTTTGISAHDRALTSRRLARVGALLGEGQYDAGQAVPGRAPVASVIAVEGGLRGIGAEEAEAERVRPEDFSRPGHLNPLRYTLGGVRKRRGHTEASVDLCLASGLPPAALLCELVDPDSPVGGIAARDACLKFARAHQLRICTIEAMVQWLSAQEQEPQA